MESLERARDDFEKRRWSDAYAGLDAADAAEPLEADDLDRLAMAAYLIGRHDDCTQAWTRAHQANVRQGQPTRAIRSAYWLWFAHMNRGEMAQANGWLSRAKEMLDECPDCVETGYLRVPD